MTATLKVDGVEKTVEEAAAIARAAMIKEHPHLEEIFNDTKLSNFKRRLKLLPYMRDLHKQMKGHQARIAELKAEKSKLTAIIDAHEEAQPWFQLSDYRLEKNECSRLHMLAESMKVDEVLLADDKTLLTHPDYDGGNWSPKVIVDYQSFVVQHDWASAFKNAVDYDQGQANLPYERCAFEFKISGRVVIFFARQMPETPIIVTWFVQLKRGWAAGDSSQIIGDEPKQEYAKLALAEIRAICIALDAEVATHSIMRAPFKLNQKREAQGKIPLFSYHLVSLNGAHRMNRKLIGGPGTHKSPRLHFRRGHWRHFMEHKTWVRWTLVGNPELGFIEKEYRL